MEVSIANKKYIRDAFYIMTNKEEFLSLLNYAKAIIYSEENFPIELRQLNYYGNPQINSKRYTHFLIKKKSGADRVIHAPVAGLKSIQRCLNLIFQTIYDVNTAANGFVPGRSIIDNAQKHVGNNYVYNIDLKDFFPSIDQARIWGRLKAEPFNLNGDRQLIGNIISSLCCTELEVERLNSESEWVKVKKSVLPQGAPTSPVLSNIICGRLDFYLQAVSKRFGLKYSRYADDITFSSMHNVYQRDSEFIKEVNRIIVFENFHIKEAKTRLQKQGYRQEVTGLTVNEKINLRSKYLKRIRMHLYFWKVYGIEKASSLSTSDKVRSSSNKEGAFMKMLQGKINYTRSIKKSTTKFPVILLSMMNTLVDSQKDVVSNDVKKRPAELIRKVK